MAKRSRLGVSLIWIAALFIVADGLTGRGAGDGEIGTMGREVTKIENTGHQVQVWEVLPEYIRQGRYRLSIKHASAGESGSFYMIAWADTNNDRIPDKEIGRSPLFTASSAGEWSSWEFDSTYDRILVGNTWKQSDDRIYYQMDGSLPGYKGLSNQVFYSREFDGKPVSSTGPRYTNIKLSFLQQSGSTAGVGEEEVNTVVNTGHQVQVWQVLPEFPSRGRFRISIKHARSGPAGSFYIVAWADTNMDGKPDKEIGRSSLMIPEREGQWSSWEFSSNYDRIFVGNTWSQDDEKVFFQTGGKLQGYRYLSSNVFYSRSFRGTPDSSTGPRFTNIKLEKLE